MRCLILDAYSYLPWLMILMQFIDANRYLIYFRCVPDFRCQQKRLTFRKIPCALKLWEVARAIPLGSRSIYIRYTMARLDEVRKNLDGSRIAMDCWFSLKAIDIYVRWLPWGWWEWIPWMMRFLNQHFSGVIWCISLFKGEVTSWAAPLLGVGFPKLLEILLYHHPVIQSSRH